MRSFHLPLPDELYAELQAEAERSKHPATFVARQALSFWLQRKQREALDRAIEEYARAAAGSREDLDPELEAASVEALLAQEEES